MSNNLLNTVYDILKKDDRLISQDGDLLKNKIQELAYNLDENLISLLLDDEITRSKFFIDIKDVKVFDSNKFIRFVDNKQFLPDSYTSYKNKIGLINKNGEYLAESNEISLAWAYKDCILAGGQDKEDSKREEVFYNDILGSDEIDVLLGEKIFTNFKRIDKDGEHKLENFKKDENGDIKDNLIIKGNNLLALHSLKSKFAGKVKLIYIDPPYNTQNDTFKYNDRFNHSTWLTFMKNRLEVARDFLSNDGVIFVQCDDNEQGYLKVLMDEIFKETNFIDTFIWKNTDNSPTLSGKTRGGWEFIHCYEKQVKLSVSYKGKESENCDAPLLNSGNNIGTLLFPEEKIRFNIPDGEYKKGTYDRIELLDDLIVQEGLNKNSVRIKGEFKWSQKNFDQEVKDGTYFLIKTKKFSIRYQRKSASNIAPEKFVENNYLNKSIGVDTNEDSKKHIDSLELDFPSFPKPESLVAFLIKAVTQEGDIIMDYHLGSGTTCAVAHKMGRQYIGVEQMDYIEDVAVERLKKVIDGEEGGVTKAFKWKGGGEFIYMQMIEENESYISMIGKAKNTESLLKIWGEIKESAFINYSVNVSDIDNSIQDFKALSIEEQKDFLIDILDKNLLYLNYSEIEDKNNKVSDEDIKLNNNFYN